MPKSAIRMLLFLSTKMLSALMSLQFRKNDFSTDELYHVDEDSLVQEVLHG